LLLWLCYILFASSWIINIFAMFPIEYFRHWTELLQKSGGSNFFSGSVRGKYRTQYR
jgi:hypothetical protein